MRRKVAVIGAGFVGATSAQRIVERELADVTLIDVVEDMPQGKALDLTEGAPLEGFDTRITGSNEMADVKGAEIVVMTAGVPRKPGMSRDDLLEVNSKIMNSVMGVVKENAPDCILINVANPLDVMTYLADKMMGLPRERIMGMAGVLDSSRLRSFIAMELDCSMEDVQAMVLGGHGDTMVPLPRFSTVSGIPIPELLPADKIEAMTKRTQGAGGEIVKLLKTGSAFYSTASAVTEMVEAILKDKKRILPVAAKLDGEYGLKGIFMGVPVKLGAKGIEQVIELKLTDEENALLKKSAEHVEKVVAELK